MKLFLSSDGISNGVLRREFLMLLDETADKCKFLFVPTAANVEDDVSYVEKDRKAIFRLGVSRDNFVEYDLDKDISGIDISDVDVVFVEGGNTFYLLDRLKKTGFDLKLKELVEGGAVYFGVSAGSIVAGSDIEICGRGDGWDKNEVGLEDLSGLGFTDKVLSPHYVEGDKRVIEKFERERGRPVTLLKDGQALVVDGEVEWVIGV